MTALAARKIFAKGGLVIVTRRAIGTSALRFVHRCRRHRHFSATRRMTRIATQKLMLRMRKIARNHGPRWLDVDTAANLVTGETCALRSRRFARSVTLETRIVRRRAVRNTEVCRTCFMTRRTVIFRVNIVAKPDAEIRRCRNI